MRSVVESFVLALATTLFCAQLFMLDHEFNSLADLLHPSSLMSFLVYGTPIWIMMLMQSLAWKAGRKGLFATIALITGMLLAAWITWAGSQATTLADHAKVFAALTGLTVALVSGSVLAVHFLFARLKARSNGRLAGT